MIDEYKSINHLYILLLGASYRCAGPPCDIYVYVYTYMYVDIDSFCIQELAMLLICD